MEEKGAYAGGPLCQGRQPFHPRDFRKLSGGGYRQLADTHIKDNAGHKPEGEEIDEDGPAAYFVNSDPLELAAAARKAGAPAYVSNHAGGYVCNHLMYAALRAIDKAGLKTKFAFIHLPLTTEMALLEKPGRGVPPSLPLSLLVKAVEAAMKAGN